MDVTHGSKISFQGSSLNHRGGGLTFKTLSNGTIGTPENYTCILARQEDFYSPVHHHNFDQFRYAYEGDISLGPNLALKQGQLSYHSEGTYYGPQTDEPGKVRLVFVLQCGGASGQGYMLHETLAQANKELAQTGKFEGGKYYGDDGSIRDGYQALWEHVNGRKMVYPKGRYHAPIVMDPESFAWKEVGKSGPGVWKRTLGVFTERELRAEQIKVDPGTNAIMTVGGEKAIELLFVLAGKGSVRETTKTGKEELLQESCVRLGAGTSAELTCEGDEPIVLLRFVMPLLE